MITWRNSTLTDNNLYTAMGVHSIPFFRMDSVFYNLRGGMQLR